MVKIVEIKPEKLLKGDPAGPKDESEEDLEDDQTEEERPIDFSDRVLVGDEVLIEDVNPTLDRRIVRSTGFSTGGSLEESLEEVPSEKVDENKPVENYKNDSSAYMGKGGVLGEVGETKRVAEFAKDGPVRNVNNWNPEFENSDKSKMYEVKRDVEGTLNEPHDAKTFEKYSSRR
ncbi:hypothetical protein H8D91_00470 [archaeon]|nr:hypothetical protein [archaeon]